MSRFLSAGKFVSLHGVRGELKIYPYCDSAEMLVAFKKLYTDSHGNRIFECDRKRAANGMVIIKLKGIDTVEEARKYIDKQLFFDREEVVLDEGAHFIVDLLGCRVVDAFTDQLYGRIINVTSNGAHDVYHIEMISKEQRYIPVVKEFIESIDIEEKVIKVKPIPGMLED